MNPNLVYPLGGDWKLPADNEVTELPGSGIAVSRPNQGILCTQIALMGANGGGWMAVNVYEDTEAFMERWDGWLKSGKPYLEYIEPLFGFRGYLPRSVVHDVVFIAPGYEERPARVKVLNEMARDLERQKSERALQGLLGPRG